MNHWGWFFSFHTPFFPAHHSSSVKKVKYTHNCPSGDFQEVQLASLPLPGLQKTYRCLNLQLSLSPILFSGAGLKIESQGAVPVLLRDLEEIFVQWQGTDVIKQNQKNKDVCLTIAKTFKYREMDYVDQLIIELRNFFPFLSVMAHMPSFFGKLAMLWLPQIRDEAPALTSRSHLWRVPWELSDTGGQVGTTQI